MTEAELDGARASVRALWETIGPCADGMVRPDPADLVRCMAVCSALRARPTTANDPVLVLVGKLETLARDPDPAWSTVIAIAAVLGDLDEALRPA